MKNILNELIDGYQEDIISDLKALVKIPSVLDTATVKEYAPFGEGVRKALDEVIMISKRLGFEVRDYDGYAASVKFGNQGKEIGVLCHADVVPVDDQWITDPFEAIIIDEKIYGRGTVDDKGPLIAVLYAMKAIQESGLPVDGHINHIIGCNEETGHGCIKYYLKKEKCPDIGFSPDGLFPVIYGEKGILRYTINTSVVQAESTMLKIDKIHAGTVVNTVPNTAKVWLSGEEEKLDKIEGIIEKDEIKSGNKGIRIDAEHLLLEFNGISAHAMQPWLGENAILSMLHFLSGLSGFSPDTEYFLNALCSLFGDGWKGENMGIACKDKLSGQLSQNLGIFSLKDNRAEIKVDIRCPIHMDLEMVWKTININCKKFNFHPVCWQMRKPLYIPKGSPLVEKLLNVYNEMTGDTAEAITIGGGTYCRDVENFVSFGPVFPYEKEMAHEANEYIGIKELILSAKMYAQALYVLLQP